MSKKNEQIRKEAKKAGVYLWQIAKYLGVGEATLIRWMREELTEQKRAMCMDAIRNLKGDTNKYE